MAGPSSRRHPTRKVQGVARRARRRIKTLEAEQRKHERDMAECEKYANLWRNPTASKRKDGSPTTLAERVSFLVRVGAGCSYELAGRLQKGEITPEEAQASVIAGHEASAAYERRWISHLENRLGYERALLNETGYVPPPKPKSKADLPILNYPGKVSYRNRYSHSDVVECEATPMTKAEFARINKDYKGTVISACGTHRLRTAMLKGHAYGIVYLTDSKQHARPDAATIAAQAEADEAAREAAIPRKLDESRERMLASEARRPEREQAAQEAAPFEAVKESAQGGSAGRRGSPALPDAAGAGHPHGRAGGNPAGHVRAGAERRHGEPGKGDPQRRPGRPPRSHRDRSEAVLHPQGVRLRGLVP